MTKPKFAINDLARVGGPDGRMPSRYPWLRKGRVVRVKAILPNQPYAGRRHSLYLISGRRGREDAWLASYELRHVEEPKLYKGPGVYARHGGEATQIQTEIPNAFTEAASGLQFGGVAIATTQRDFKT